MGKAKEERTGSSGRRRAWDVPRRSSRPPLTSSTTLQGGDDEVMLPEKEEYRIELFKDERRGLGITVAGYVCEKGER